MESVLASHPAAPGSIPGIAKVIDGAAACGELNNDDRTRLGLVLKKYLPRCRSFSIDKFCDMDPH